MTPSHRLIVPAHQADLRIDQFLAATGLVSRTRARALLASGSVYLDRHRTKVASRTVKAGQVVEVYLVEPVAAAPLPPIQVLYQDAHLVVVNKPAGMPVQAARDTDQGCLTTALAKQLTLPSQEIRVVHRLDEDTSGVVVLALTQEAAAHLSQQFSEHTAQRIYLAVGVGLSHPDETLQHYLTHIHLFDEGPARVEARPAVGTPGVEERLAISHCQVVAQQAPDESSVGYSLVQVRLETGRTHQIRAQLAAAGLPIVGDTRYGAPQLPRSSPLQRLALHAAMLTFVHPADVPATLPKKGGQNGDRSSAALPPARRFYAPVPEDLTRWLELHGLWLPVIHPDGAGRIPLFIQEDPHGQDSTDSHA